MQGRSFGKKNRLKKTSMEIFCPQKATEFIEGNREL
jgi:hypothetical protein